MMRSNLSVRKTFLAQHVRQFRPNRAVRLCMIGERLCMRGWGLKRDVQVEVGSGMFLKAQLADAVQALAILVERGARVDNSLFYDALKRCILEKDLVRGIRVHDLVVRSGYESNAFLANHIICMYASHGRLEDAMHVFSMVARPSRYMWASIILAHARHGQAKRAIQLYLRLRESKMKPDNHIFVAALKACATAEDLPSGKDVHADVLVTLRKPNLFVGNCLVDMYAKCGSLEDAGNVFDNLVMRDVVTWNVMIGAYAQRGLGQEAFALYDSMRQEGRVSANSVTFISLLQACASVEAVRRGKQLHAEILNLGLEVDVVMGNCLVDMYAKCGSLEDARQVFNGLPVKDVVTWNSMIGGYSHHGHGFEALTLYESMQLEGVTAANAVTFVCLLQACGSVASLEKGKEIHAQMFQAGFSTSNLFVANALIDMYTKCLSLEDARVVFDNLAQRDVVTWTTMIAAYAQSGLGRDALALHSRMLQDGRTPADAVTFMCLLQVCGSLGALHQGREIHKQVWDSGLETDMLIGTCLVDMYAKCGDVREARRVFDRLQIRDVASWNAMIAGYVEHGQSYEAFSLYETMQQEGVTQADAVTFGCLLRACSKVAGLEKGKEIHAYICELGLEATIFLGNALVHMYASCGSMTDAQQVFDALTERDTVTWSALIAGYSRHGDSESVFELLQGMKHQGVQPSNITFLSVLKVCSHVGLLDQGEQYFSAMVNDYNLTPTIEHYNCLIDMFGRAGQLRRALEILWTMPFPATIEVWRCVLGACQKWNDVELGRQAFERAVGLEKLDSALYVAMPDTQENAGMPEQLKIVQLGCDSRM